MSESLIIVSIFVIYIVGLVYNVFSNSKTFDYEEYSTGGRSFSWPFVALTIFGTSTAGSLLTGYTQMGHDVGIVVTYYVVSATLGLYFFLMLCGPLWRVGKHYGVKTLGEYLGLRYGSKPMRVFMGAALLLIEFPWIIAELLASGYAIQVLTNYYVSFNMGIVIVGVLFIVYVMFAGMKAVMFADYYQGWIFIIAAATLFISAVYYHFGSWGNMWKMTRDLNEELLWVPGDWWGTVPGPLVFTSLILVAAFGAYMYPSLFSRIFTAGSTKELKASLNVTPWFMILLGLTIFLISIGSASLPQFGAQDSSYAFIEFISSMGPVAKALMAIVILAGAVSMMEAMLSSWSIVLTNDIVKPFKKELTDGQQLIIARVFTAVIGIAGICFAMMELPIIFQIVTRVYQVIVQAFPIVFLGLYWKRGNLAGAWAGIIVGFSIVAITSFTMPDQIPWLGGLQGGLLALVFNVIAYVVVSLLTTKGQGTDELFTVFRGKNVERLG